MENTCLNTKEVVVILHPLMPKPLYQISFDFSQEETRQEEEQLPVMHESPAPGMPDQASQEEIQIKEGVAETPPSTPITATAVKPKGRRSLKHHTDAPIQLPPDDVLFKKSYYPIGEVATMFGVNQSLLRYWETEFTILKPRKNGKGDRYFRPQDVKNLQLIHDLLRRRKYTIEGAKAFLKHNAKKDEHFDMIRSLEKMKAFLLELKASL